MRGREEGIALKKEQLQLQVGFSLLISIQFTNKYTIILYHIESLSSAHLKGFKDCIFKLE